MGVQRLTGGRGPVGRRAPGGHARASTSSPTVPPDASWSMGRVDSRALASVATVWFVRVLGW